MEETDAFLHLMSTVAQAHAAQWRAETELDEAREVIRKIANQDYRINRPVEQYIAAEYLQKLEPLILETDERREQDPRPAKLGDHESR